MATNLTVATFNCENLFSRPKALAELRKDPFDKSKIKSLRAKLKGFATLNEVRGKIRSRLS